MPYCLLDYVCIYIIHIIYKQCMYTRTSEKWKIYTSSYQIATSSRWICWSLRSIGRCLGGGWPLPFRHWVFTRCGACALGLHARDARESLSRKGLCCWHLWFANQWFGPPFLFPGLRANNWHNRWVMLKTAFSSQLYHYH